MSETPRDHSRIHNAINGGINHDGRRRSSGGIEQRGMCIFDAYACAKKVLNDLASGNAQHVLVAGYGVRQLAVSSEPSPYYIAKMLHKMLRNK